MLKLFILCVAIFSDIRNVFAGKKMTKKDAIVGGYNSNGVSIGCGLGEDFTMLIVSFVKCENVG